MRRREHQSGFSTVELLLVVLVIGIVGAAGWFVYQHNRTKATQAAPNASNQQTQQTTTTTPAPTVAYLTLKEWGVKLPLSDSIKDSYYTVPRDISSDPDGQPSGVYLGMTSLNTSCGIVTPDSKGIDNALGAITRVPPTYTDPVSGELFTQKYPGGVTINGYYYVYASRTSGKTCASASTLQNADSAFATAVKSIATSTAN